MVLRLAFALFVFYALYAFIIEPQLSYLLKWGWKRLAATYNCQQPVELPPAPQTLARVGWNQFLVTIHCQPEGVYLQRGAAPSAAHPPTLLIPYAHFCRVSQPVAARLFAADQYDFFSVRGVAFWVAKKYSPASPAR
jgi:hypothetical protein